uniref:Uncharacterized protein n=1 Tax=Siphoviridae sp. ctnsL8 TaxID=2825666 RepID=A0A8S5PN48_9CAUD|nr:MAG TPA: hypothetical protein [Siphoviridae sp. ctnsL8]
MCHLFSIFHLYGINEVYENKKSGIYSHSKA